MNFLHKHWFDIGGIVGIITLLLLGLFYNTLSNYQLLMWLSLVTLFFHQMEEYRIVGTFPGMINSMMFKSEMPDRYPLNTNTSFIINVWVGWTVYLVAALTGERYIWLGMATIIVSLGNVVAHTFLFNIKGKTIYNAGLATSWLLFVPCIVCFFKIIHQEHLVTKVDYFIGVPLGIFINIVGVFKPISWLANKNTPFAFKESQLLPRDRQSNK